MRVFARKWRKFILKSRFSGSLPTSSLFIPVQISSDFSSYERIVEHVFWTCFSALVRESSAGHEDTSRFCIPLSARGTNLVRCLDRAGDGGSIPSGHSGRPQAIPSQKVPYREQSFRKIFTLFCCIIRNLLHPGFRPLPALCAAPDWSGTSVLARDRHPSASDKIAGRPLDKLLFKQARISPFSRGTGGTAMKTRG